MQFSLQFVHVDEVTLDLSRINMVTDLDIELSEVRLTLSASNASVNHVSLTHIQVMFHVEYSLLPMSVLLVRTRAQKNRILQVGEWRVEPSDKTVDSVSVLHVQRVLCGELDVFLLAVDEVKAQYFAVV